MEELERSLADRVHLHPLRDNFAKIKSKFPARRTWSVVAPKPGNNQSGWRSDRDGKTTGSSLVGMVLARRYKILEAIEADSFKAHDLALDQTVTVRQTCVKSQGGGDAWRQKVQQFAKVKDPNFLNVIDVIFDKSNVSIVTERPRGRSIADLLREGSRLDVEDVLRLVAPLAGAIDLAAAFSSCPNPISACWLFIETSSCAADLKWRPLSDWPPFLVKLDVWELVRPGKNDMRPFVTAKAQSNGSRALAVRRAALLTYELLGGGKRKDGQAERRFQPVSELSDAANGILYLGLQGSPRFETSESFFHEFRSSIQSGEGGSNALPAPASQLLERSLAFPVIPDAIRRFHRDTVWLATLAAGAVFSAALMLTVLVQNNHPKAVDLKNKTVDAGRDLLGSADSGTPFRDVDLNRKKLTGEISGQSRADQASTAISPKENRVRPTEAAAAPPTPVLASRAEKAAPRTEARASIPASVLAFTPEKADSQTEAAAPGPTPVPAFKSEEATAPIPTPVLAITPETNQANTSSRSSAYWRNSARENRPKIRHGKSASSVEHRSSDVKTRLIALWHQSLARAKNPRHSKSATKLNGGVQKKGNHTTTTSH
jgi:hypothetical protein